MSAEQEAYNVLQEKIRQVFITEMLDDVYTETQRNLLDVMLANAARRSGGPDKVTLAQVQGVKEMLEQQFSLAAALSDAPLDPKEDEK
jgi:hypothetical protein